MQTPFFSSPCKTGLDKLKEETIRYTLVTAGH